MDFGFFKGLLDFVEEIEKDEPVGIMACSKGTCCSYVIHGRISEFY